MFFLVLLACAGPTDSVDSGEPTTHVEVCNGHDDDGDGLIDEGLQLSGYIDADGDGVGAESSEVTGGKDRHRASRVPDPFTSGERRGHAPASSQL